DALKSLFGARRRRVLGPVLLAGRVARSRPHQGGVCALALAQRLGCMRARAFETHAKVGDEPDRNLVLAAARDGLVVSLPRVLPLRRRLAVVEDRLAVQAQLDAPDDASRRAQQDVLGLAVGWRPAIRPRAPLAVVPGPDAHGDAHDEPAGARAPRRLEHEHARQVASPRGHLDARGSEAEAAGGTVEDGGKDARAVGTRKAHPLHPSAGCDQAVDLAVRQEGVFGDGRERAGDARPGGLRLGFERRPLAVPVDRGADRLAPASIASSACAWRKVRGKPSSSTPAPVSASGRRLRTISTISSSGTRSPAAMMRPASVPTGVPFATSARRMSPVERCLRRKSFSILAAWVPLPLPGGPKMMPITRGGSCAACATMSWRALRAGPGSQGLGRWAHPPRSAPSSGA